MNLLYSTAEFFRGVSLLLGAAVGVAFVSRIAKNFQDYYINVITQRLGAQLYSDGIRHSLDSLTEEGAASSRSLYW
jgi:ATP-binding cassette subfamily B protein